MSVTVMSNVMKYYPGAGGEYTLALCLADFANDDGASIFPSVMTLAHNSRQSERTVQRQLRAMEESGWLLKVGQGGGSGRATRYRIDPDWINNPGGWRKNGDKLSPFLNGDKKGDTPQKRVTSEAGNGDTAVSPDPSMNHQYSPLSPHVSEIGCAEPSDDSEARADCELAEWMFGLVKTIHPEHKPPNWSRWKREIRLLRERDGHSRREIGGLFRWANGHSFWSANIRSPGKLRQQWDTLVLQRKRDGGGIAATDPGAVDRQCVRCHDGTMGRRGVPGIGWLCNRHIDEQERGHG